MNLFDNLAGFGDSVALITENVEYITYRDVVDSADKISAEVEERSLVFCVCRNAPEAVTGYIGFLRNRTVPVLVADSLKPVQYEKLLQAYKPKYVWMPIEFSGIVENAQLVHQLGGYVLVRTPFVIDYALHDDLAILLTTSGSTGSPKLVRLSYRNLTSNARAIANYLEICSDDRPITSLPMSYTYGLSIINSHLLMGASLVLTGKTLMDKRFWELLKLEKATTFGGVPYTYEMLKKLRFERMELPHLRYLTQAGGKMDVDLSRYFANTCRNKGIAFIPMYGQTEATARMSYLPGEYSAEKSGSIGKPIPGGEFWLEDSSGSVIAEPDVAGELVYRGENVCMGYANTCYDLQKGDENQGVLRTGDIARRDSDGFYYIVGRKKRFIKLFGNRVNLDEVEGLLRAAGFECACSGEDDDLRIYMTGDSRQEEIRKHLLSVSDLNPSGIRLLHIEALPYNESGKILYSALDLTFASGKGGLA